MASVIRTNASVHMDKAQLELLLNRPEGDVGRYIGKRARLVAAMARSKVGVKSGRLKRSIRVYGANKTTLGQEIYIGSSVPYALMHHNGTRPHLIRARQGRVLKFRTGMHGPANAKGNGSKGMFVYAHVVHHPGTKPNPYLLDSLYLING
jgi:predicted RNA-binding protein YlqC (UPF0109 family)